MDDKTSMSAIPPLPSHLERWDKMDRMDPDDQALIMAAWRHFEPELVSRGYQLHTDHWFGPYVNDGSSRPCDIDSKRRPGESDDHKNEPTRNSISRPCSENAASLTKSVRVLADDLEKKLNTDGLVQARRTCICSYHTSRNSAKRSNVIVSHDLNGRWVVLKALHIIRGKRELDIVTFLDSPLLRSQPHNHTVPILDNFKIQDWNFIVMPYWSSPFEGQLVQRQVDDYFDLLIQALEVCMLNL